MSCCSVTGAPLVLASDLWTSARAAWKGDTMPEQDRSGAWHQSTLETLLDGCSWAYYLEYVQGLPSAKSSTLAGSAFHAGVELHEEARLNKENLPELNDMVQAGHDWLEGKELVLPEHYEEVEAALTHWWGAPMKDGSPSHRLWVRDMEPLAIEDYFRVGLVDGALPIAGTMDAVYRDGDTIRLVDWKTANNLSRWGHEGAEHRRQATLYAVGVLLAGKWPEVTELPTMTYCVSRRSKGKSRNFEAARRVLVEPSLADVETLGNRIREAERVVEEGKFVRRPDWVLCSKQWCPFYQGCMVTNELSPYGLSQSRAEAKDSVV